MCTHIYLSFIQKKKKKKRRKEKKKKKVATTDVGGRGVEIEEIEDCYLAFPAPQMWKGARDGEMGPMELKRSYLLLSILRRAFRLDALSPLGAIKDGFNGSWGLFWPADREREKK